MTLEVTLYMVFVLGILVMAVSGVPDGLKGGVNDDMRRREMVIVDHALSMYYQSHVEKNGGVYPVDLVILQNIGLLPNHMDLSGFIYSTQSAGSLYRLVVTLPSGVVAVSNGSKY